MTNENTLSYSAPSTNSNSDKLVRFSVVIGESHHTKLENYVREYSFKNHTKYAKSDFVRAAIIAAIEKVEADVNSMPLDVPFNPKKVKTEPNIRFSVVINEHIHDRLENYVREYSYKNRVDFTKSDFVRDSIIAALSKVTTPS